MITVKLAGLRSRAWPGVVVCLVTATLAGCSSGVSVRHVSESSLLADWYASAIESKELSPRTQQTMRQLDLADLFQRQPLEAFHKLQELAIKEKQPDILFALAEITYHLGSDAERHQDREAVVYYYLCAGYAYHYLFDDGYSDQDSASQKEFPEGKEAKATSFQAPVFDPRFRLACDLYNRGLSKCIRIAQRVGRLDARQVLRLPTADAQQITLSVSHHGFAWTSEEFGPLLFCSDYQVVGLDNHYRSFGLGVPLIGVRVHAAESAPGQAFYPREVSFPVTAFFRFQGSLADLTACRAGRLELVNPVAMRQVVVKDRPVPLEADLTTPLAYFLSRTDLSQQEYAGFLRPDRLKDQTGVYFFEPYQQGKIPVLMIHGLLSSPVTWAPLFNDLRADPVLNARYQFWFYRYPTGNPYLLTAADLRQSLDRLRAALDPQHADPAFDKMVLVGHSMGGLIAKLLTQDSGDDFWKLVSQQPFDQLRGTPEDRDQVQRVFYFEKELGVRRVIFLATPHHGSKLSPSPPARLLAKLIRLPSRLQEVTADLMKDNPGFWTDGKGHKRIPTSIDLLSPSSPALELLAGRQGPPGVLYHSVIGVAHGRIPDGGDGVVSYRSAHIDGGTSEVVVPADHTHVHHHAGAVLEVRRILYEHLQLAEAKDDPGVRQAGVP
jgi:pimeloyl-ACP methyl ester carboxylesterase